MNNDPHAHDVLTDDRFGAQVGRLLGPPRARATRPAGTNFGRRVMRPVADGIPRHRDPDLRRLAFHGLRRSLETWMIAVTSPKRSLL
jgi:hypothetical protein